MLRSALVPLVTAAVVVPLAAQGPGTTFREGTELVHLGVTVTDRNGKVITGLTAADFEVTEDGRPQQIQYFAQGSDASAPELHIGLMLDTSESMASDLDTSRRAAIRFLNRLPEAEDITLVEFATSISIGRFSQDDFPRLIERIRSGGGEGYTALYDALALFLHRANDYDGRTVLVAFTDGGDSRSTIDFNDALTAVRVSDATIYVVGLLEHQPRSTVNEQRLRLAQIAEASGGVAIFPRSMREIERAYDALVEEIHGQYSLGYVSSNPRRDGRWREVKVRLTRDVASARVRSREGYYAPSGPEP